MKCCMRYGFVGTHRYSREGYVTIEEDGSFTIVGDAVPEKMRSILRSIARARQSPPPPSVGRSAAPAAPEVMEPMDPFEAQMLVMAMKETECRKLAQDNENLRREMSALVSELASERSLVGTLKAALAASPKLGRDNAIPGGWPVMPVNAASRTDDTHFSEEGWAEFEGELFEVTRI